MAEELQDLRVQFQLKLAIAHSAASMNLNLNLSKTSSLLTTEFILSKTKSFKLFHHHKLNTFIEVL